MKKNKKYIFITGGVVSSVGKGLISASLSALLESMGYKINIIKCDPYLNVDPGTLSPFQHGEVYVTEDGMETDLDLGHYERFTNSTINGKNSITMGNIYQTVINKERKGDYLGSTVQIIPHITDEIKDRIQSVLKEDSEITVVEIGGTVGDIEGLSFIEAIRQMRVELGMSNTIFCHVTYVPYVQSAGELKSKPSQHSVKALREVGLQPDFLICRSHIDIPEDMKKKIALFSNLSIENVIPVKDVETIYEIPLILKREKFHEKIIHRLGLKLKETNMKEWESLVYKLKHPKEEVFVGLIGKYVHLKDSYQSIHEALVHGGLANDARVNIKYIDSEKEDLSNIDHYKDLNGILIPGGFGNRGIDGKIQAAKYARENTIPFFGICLGLQAAAIEFARNVCGIKQANSREFSSNASEFFVIDVMGLQKKIVEKGGSMRLGSYPCILSENSKVKEIYKLDKINERHRHRYEFNQKFSDIFEEKGMRQSGHSEKTNLTEILELKSHPWYIGVQFHPEFLSKLTKPHPLFVSFIKACKDFKNQ